MFCGSDLFIIKLYDETMHFFCVCANISRFLFQECQHVLLFNEKQCIYNVSKSIIKYKLCGDILYDISPSLNIEQYIRLWFQ